MAKPMRMGTANNVTKTSRNIPWSFFKSNSEFDFRRKCRDQNRNDPSCMPSAAPAVGTVSGNGRFGFD